MRGTGALHGIEADLSEVSELTPVIAALAALADGPSELRGVAHIRGHETDRIAALAPSWARSAPTVIEHPDGLEITPGPLRGGHLRDVRRPPDGARRRGHRPGRRRASQLSDVACTSKTLPEFPELWAGTLVTARS